MRRTGGWSPPFFGGGGTPRAPGFPPGETEEGVEVDHDDGAMLRSPCAPRCASSTGPVPRRPGARGRAVRRPARPPGGDARHQPIGFLPPVTATCWRPREIGHVGTSLVEDQVKAGAQPIPAFGGPRHGNRIAASEHASGERRGSVAPPLVIRGARSYEMLVQRINRRMDAGGSPSELRGRGRRRLHPCCSSPGRLAHQPDNSAG